MGSANAKNIIATYTLDSIQRDRKPKTVTSQNEFVSLQRVTKTYGTFRALNNVTLNIHEGEVFGYIGPNGAGKTTTMKILVGLISDFQGSAQIGGYDVCKQREQVHKLLGYLPQAVAFQDWRTVNQALRTFGKLSGLTDAETEARIPETLELVGLADVRHKKISKLSGGMTQKVGLAQALLHDPKLLVLDEPLGGLDPLSRYQFKETILKLSRKGTTTVFSSHILSDVQDVADRVGVINRGEILQVGTLSELKSRFSAVKTVEVQLSFVTDKWQELKSIRSVKEVSLPSPDRILLTLAENADEDQVVNDAVKAIINLGIRIRGITVLAPSLDMIYFNFVQEADNQ
jgi:ABC-2 type transport system ATP-binding protein